MTPRPLLGRFALTGDGRRAAAASAAPPGPLRDLAEAGRQDGKTPVDELRLLAVDLETSDLDCTRGHILSIGFVPVDGLQIELAGAGHVLVAAEGEVGQSAVFHGLTDDDVASGVTLSEALVPLLRALSGRILLAHFASLEVAFLNAACRRVYGAGLPVRTVDTMTIQERLVCPSGQEPEPGALRLWSAREYFGLPRYKAHESLTDAMACAELYLAQVDRLSTRDRRLTLRDLSRR